ncbi:MAG: hypothetical protein KGJ80_11050 [Chloroflexota bacterium]|nr:hypothetical protein [Chloroflexota bacterium]
MTRHLNAAGLAITLVVVALLACSPLGVLNGLIGQAQTQTPTNTLAQAQTPTTIAQALASPQPGSTVPPTAPAAGTPSNQTPTIEPTNTPLPLPLRTDLPALALRDWPRPANDNGRCIHFLPTGYYTPRDFEVQIPRMKALQMRWVLALYSDENQLRLAAQQFKAAGVMPIWRKSMRAYQKYYSWDRDIQILKYDGITPYFQIYNEPDSGAEWDGRDVDQAQWTYSFVQAAKDVYNAGGYVGMQVLDPDWVRAVIREIKAEKGDRIFGRMFFVPHSYALNHPPNYVEDENAVLGFRMYADVFQQELGFIPPFIVGEGGWKYHATDDNRYPMIDDQTEAKYYVELFNWFRPQSKLSNGEPLPDYLFAFCPWILAAPLEGAAWYDSFEKDRTLTIEAVTKMGTFKRLSSWDKK